MLTTNVRKAILDNIAGIAATSMPRGLYMGLSTTTPTQTGTNFTEPLDQNYERIYIGSSIQEGSNFPFEYLEPAESGATQMYNQVANKYEIHFNTATANWGTITYVGIFSAKTGGQLIAYTPLTTPLTVNQGYIPTILKHAAVISIDAEILDSPF